MLVAISPPNRPVETSYDNFEPHKKIGEELVRATKQRNTRQVKEIVRKILSVYNNDGSHAKLIFPSIKKAFRKKPRYFNAIRRTLLHARNKLSITAGYKPRVDYGYSSDGGEFQ